MENFEVVENDIFDCKVLWMVGKGEWNSYLVYLVYLVTFITAEKRAVVGVAQQSKAPN